MLWRFGSITEDAEYNYQRIDEDISPCPFLSLRISLQRTMDDLYANLIRAVFTRMISMILRAFFLRRCRP